MAGAVSAIRGIAFPFQKGELSVPAQNARLTTVVDAVKSLLLIGVYEVPLAPMLGTAIYSYIFENMTPLTMARVASEVRRIITENEPRMRVISVVPSQQGNDVGGYRIVLQIQYELNGVSDSMEIVL